MACVPSVEERVQTLKDQIATANAERTRREVERDQALAAIEKVRKILREEFGAESDEAAQSVLEDLEAERDRLLTEAEAALEETHD